MNRTGITARRVDEIVVPSMGDDQENHGSTFLVVLWRRRWIILRCILTALISGYIYLLKAVPIYASSSTVYVQQSIPKIVSDEITSQGNSSNYLYTQCMLIQSTAICSAAAEKPGVRDLKCLVGMDNPVPFIRGSVSAKPGQQGDFITVSMESTNPQDAATIVNAVVEAFIDYQTKQHQSTAVEVLRILQKERDSHEAELKAAQDAIFAYKKANPDVGMNTDKGDVNVDVNRLNALCTALTNAELRQLDIKMALAEADIAGNSPVVLKQLFDRLQTPVAGAGGGDAAASGMQLAEAQYQQDQEHLYELLEDYGTEFPEVKKLQHRLDRERSRLSGLGLSEQSQTTTQSYGDVLRQALATTDRYVAELQRQVDQERQVVMALSVKDAEYEQLLQQKDRVDKTIDLLDSRMKDINVTEDVGALTVSVLEFAKPEFQPVRPKRAQTMGMALLAGLMVGLGGALLRDTLDQRLRSIEEIAMLLDLPILGAVPHMLAKLIPAEKGQEIHLRPHSDVSEAYRTIRTALYFGLDDAKSAKTILVTSPVPGDGKSTLISNLAIAIAQAGRRVLIIDADCRRPMQQKIFQLPSGPGLSSVLKGKIAFAEAVQKTSIDKLDILQCGPLPSNPAEILNSQAFLDLLGAARATYDQVLIDSPPVMPVSDSRILAASCDATILVIRAESSTRRLTEHAKNALVAVGGSLIGVVVNDAPRGPSGYGYYGYYYYGYGKYGYTSSSKGNGDDNGNGDGDDKGDSERRSAAIIGQADVDQAHVGS